MNKTFWRPFLLMAGTVILLATYAHMLPVAESEFFTLKRLHLIQSVRQALSPAAADTLQQAAKRLVVEDAFKPMLSFVEKLAEQEDQRRGNLRIAYFGDSIIEGDLISGKLREQLQLNYGGIGVGLVPITSIVNEFRRTVRHSFSRNWETLSFMNRGYADTPMGVIGYTFIPRNYYYTETVVEAPRPALSADTTQTDTSKLAPVQPRKEMRRSYLGGPAWVEYGTVDYPGGVSEFRRIRLFYSHAGANSRILVQIDGGETKTYTLNGNPGLQMLDLSPAAPAAKVRLQFDPAAPVHVYGVSFDDHTGLYVDNFSVRGFSGMHLNTIPSDYLREFQRHLGYDLIILQYGENVSDANIRDYSFYKRGMKRSIEHLQDALPGVPILIVSAHDRSIRQGGVFQTSPDIPILVNTQAEFAAETGCAFWNAFTAMGGINSMPVFVQSSPPLANLDYTHFTRAGADKIALMLYQAITTGKSQ